MDLTRTICNFFNKNELKTKIIGPSSTKAKQESQYGRSKRDAEEILADLSKNLNPVKISGIFENGVSITICVIHFTYVLGMKKL